MRVKLRSIPGRVAAALLLVGVALVGAATPARAAEPVVAGTAYTITNVASGKVLDVRDFSTADGGVVQQWGGAGSANQRWTFAEQGDGSYAITNVHSQKVLDVAGWGTADGTRVIQWRWLGGDNQKFTVTDAGDGSFYLRAKHSGKVLDVPNGTTADGTAVQQWASWGGAMQRWRITPAAAGTGGGGGSTPPPSSGGQSGPPAGTGTWKQTFADDFNTLDAAKWRRGWACGNGQPADCFFYNRLGTHYPDSNVTVADGQLNLRTAYESREGQAWTSGAINTRVGFAQAYGYFEVRMRPDSRAGGDPCFWLANAASWPPEIDIAEFPGAFRGRTVGNPILHPEGASDQYKTKNAPDGSSWNDAFHTYALLWEPGRITGYIDGQPTGTISTSAVPSKEMFLILSDEVRSDDGAWFGNPLSDTSTRNTKVDWVRVWSR